MSRNSLGFIILAFVLYLLAMIVVGVVCAKENNSTEDYFWEEESWAALWRHCLHRPPI